MSEAPVERLGHVGALDGVRGLALALVVVHHVVVRSPDPLIRGGWIGVDLFFALSGFLITLSVLGFGGARVGEYFRRRFWRIGPAMIVLFGAYLAWSVGADDVGQRMTWAIAAVTQWANIQGAVGPPFSPHLGHVWSLSAEVQFYVAWGIGLAWLLRRRAPRQVVAALLVLLFVASAVERAVLWEGGTPWNRLYLGPDTHSGSLLVGCMAGLLFGWGRLPSRRVIGVLVVPALAVLAWGVVELSFLDSRAYTWALTAIALASGVIVVSAAVRAPSVLLPVLDLSLLRWLGRISYSVYLWHLPIIEEVSRRRPDDIAGIALISIPITLAVGWLSYTFVERPFLTSAGRARLRSSLSKG